MSELLKDPLVVWVVASGWLAWIAKEVISLLLKRFAERCGKHEYLRVRSGVVCDIMLEDGEYASLDWYPRYPNFSLETRKARRLRIEFEGDIVNHSDVQVVYSKPVCEIWGIEGRRLVWKDPTIVLPAAEGQVGVSDRAVSITVPAHGSTRLIVRLSLSMVYEKALEQLHTTFAEAVAQLMLSPPKGRPRVFRVCTSSFAGENLVVWPGRTRYPIYNTYALNERGRRAGRRAQRRRGN